MHVDGGLPFSKLSQLPYLRACIKEGVRHSHAVSARNPRVFNKELKYKGWTVPPRRPVSMTIADVQFYEDLYQDAIRFAPERWLGDAKSANGESLEQYFVGFGKGQRVCLRIK